jgi:hypothetical protein
MLVRIGAVASFAFAPLVLLACTSPPPTAPAPAVASLPTISSLTITGLPASVSYGQVLQLTATATLADGTTKEVLEPVAQWSSSNPSIATVSSNGLVTITGIGEAKVTATVEHAQGAVHLAVPEPAAPVARLAVRIDDHGSAAAIAGATEIDFDASASSGAGLRYHVAFGDGTFSNSAAAAHVYSGDLIARRYEVRLTVTDVLGRSDVAAETVQLVRLSMFAQDWYYPSHLQPEAGLKLGQSGARITGQYSYQGRVTPLTGTLDSRNNIYLALNDGSTVLEGPVVLKEGYQGWYLRLLVRGGPDDGITRRFVYYSSY